MGNRHMLLKSKAEHDETGMMLPQSRHIRPVLLLLGNALKIGSAAKIQSRCAGSAAAAKLSHRAELNILMMDNRRI